MAKIINLIFLAILLKFDLPTLVMANNFSCTNGNIIPYIDICNGFADCSDKSDETDKLCLDIVCPPETFQCDYGACIDDKKICDGKADCFDESDEEDNVCEKVTLSCDKGKCGKYCHPITSKRYKMRCLYENHEVRCDKDIKPGTSIEYSCGDHFVPSDKNFSGKSVCQLNGDWSMNISQCTPKCGTINPITPLIVNGRDTRTPFPWHTTMFLRKHDHWDFACGGSLITENLILSASHCFTHVSESDIVFFIGKIHNNFTILKDEKDAKLYGVKKVIRHPLYLDQIGNYGSDIAVVLLNETVELNDDIHPVCLDLKLEEIVKHLKGGSIGYSTGMGINENDTNSEIIRIVKLPVISNRKCIEQQSRDFKKFIRLTTFCAGWANGTGVCNGDSGGGLVFKSSSPIDDDKWYVQGVVSLSPRRESTFFCDPSKYTVFTKVGLYIKWIKKIISHIHSPFQTDFTDISYEAIL